jgi:hypothetical protein
MRFMVKTIAIAGLAALAACSGGADDKAAANVTAATDNASDSLEAQADATDNKMVEDQLEDASDNTEDAGAAKADQIDDKDDARLENQQ